MIDWIATQLQTNQFFGGAVAGTVMVGLMTQLKGIPGKLWDQSKKLFLLSMYVNDDYGHYSKFAAWLSSRPAFNTSKRIKFNGSTRRIELPSGTFFGLIKNWPFWLEINIQRNENGGWTKSLELTTLAFGRSRMLELIAQFKEEHPELFDDEGLKKITPGDFSYTELALQERPVQTVFTEGNQAQRVIDDIRSFYKKRSLYNARGIPFKRCFLLEGKPGTGKSSFARAIATELRKDLAVLDFANMNDRSFMRIWNDLPLNCIVLIEDIDAANNSKLFKRVEEDDDGDSVVSNNNGAIGVNLATILNVLDGPHSRDDVIVFITTNHPEILDPALLRPGRVDVRIHLDYFTSETARGMIEAWGDKPDEVLKLLNADEEGKYKPAEVQEVLLSRMKF